MNEGKKPMLLAHCKATHSYEEAVKLCEAFINTQTGGVGEIYLAVPFTFISPLSKHFAAKGVQVGAEEMLPANNDSFTTSIADKVLNDAGAKFVLIGTPQERQFTKGDDLNNKVKLALAKGVVPFLCIGETLQEHQDGEATKVLGTQLQSLINDISPEQLKNITFVYNVSWIYQSLWDAKSEELDKAYKTFIEVVKKHVDPSIFDSLRLLPSIPVYSQTLPQLVANFKDSFSNYFFGVLDVSAAHIYKVH